MHAADQIEIQPTVPLQPVPDAAFAIRDHDLVDAARLEFADQRNG